MDEQMEYLICCLELQLSAYGLEFADLNEAIPDMLENLSECWWQQDIEQDFTLPEFIELVTDDKGPGFLMRLHWEGYGLDARIVPARDIDEVVERILRNIPK